MKPQYVFVDQYGTLYRVPFDSWVNACRDRVQTGRTYDLDAPEMAAKVLRRPPPGIGKHRIGRGWSGWQKLSSDVHLVKPLGWTYEDFSDELKNLVDL